MSSASTQQHRDIAAKQGPVHVAIITVSDTRTRENDTGGDIIEQRVAGAGHTVVFRAIVKDEPDQIGALLDKITGETDARLVLFTGVSASFTVWPSGGTSVISKPCSRTSSTAASLTVIRVSTFS